MTYISPENYTPEALANSDVSAETLAEIVQTRHDLWAAVAAHPNCYPELSAYIAQYLPTLGVAQEAPVTPSFTGMQAPIQTNAPAANATSPQWTNYAQPAPSPVGMGPAMTAQSTPGQAYHSSAAQSEIAQGAQQILAGGKSLFHAAEAEAAAHGQPVNLIKAAIWGRLAIPVAVLALFLSVFLPLSSVNEYSLLSILNATGYGAPVILLLIALLVLSVVAFLFTKPVLRIITDVLGLMLASAFLLVSTAGSASISAWGSYAFNSQGAIAGFGLVLMTLASLALTAGSILSLLPKALRK